MTGRQARLNGTVLHVEDTGEEGLPTVLCLHSLFLDGRMFEGFLEAASGIFRVVRPDFRGQGRSAGADTDLIDLDTCAQDMAILTDELGLSEVHILAQSMGGDVGFRLAALRPSLVGSMVVLGSSARSEPEGQLARFRQWVDEVGKHGFTSGDVLEQTMAIMFGETTRNDPSKRDVVRLWQSRIAALPPTLRPAMSGVIERRSVVNLLPKIAAPVLVISGTEDVARPPEWSDEVVNALPDAQLWRLEGVGHSLILEAPRVVLPRVIGFLRSLEA